MPSTGRSLIPPITVMASLLVVALVALLPLQGRTADAASRDGASPDRSPAPPDSPAVATAPSPRTVEPPDSFALLLEGDMDLGGFVFQEGFPLLHTDGGATYFNTALGLDAMTSLTPGDPSPESGSRNSAFGFAALRNNTLGHDNTAAGYAALYSNVAGARNTAFGSQPLSANSFGNQNTAIGYQALASNIFGSSNTAVGDGALSTMTIAGLNTAIGVAALRSTTGTGNTGLGHSAGTNWTDGSNNIAVGGGAYGEAGETATIRIGGNNKQNRTFIEGIFQTNVTGAAVYVTSDDRLGLTTSSVRFKEDVQDLEGVGDRLAELRPVSFRYKEEIADRAENPIEYGLIAEEVEEVFPELVLHDEEGRPYAVRYRQLTPLLLAEIQRQQRELDRLRSVVEEVAELRRLVTDQRRQFAASSP
jgi:hypothetical protein